jgi:hypothetical protein
MTRAMMLGLALLAATAATGCDRSKMTASHGRAYREAFARQVANPGAGERKGQDKVVQGLDSQEAAIVAKTYRKNLAPKEDENSRGQLLYTTPRSGQPERNDLPPPSVPNEK